MSFSNLPTDIFAADAPDRSEQTATPHSGRSVAQSQTPRTGGVIIGEHSDQMDMQRIMVPALRGFLSVGEELKQLRAERLRICVKVNERIKILTAEKKRCEETIIDILQNGPSDVKGIVLDDGRIFTTRATTKKKRRSNTTKEKSIRLYLEEQGIHLGEDDGVVEGILGAADGPTTQTHKLMLSKQSGS